MGNLFEMGSFFGKKDNSMSEFHDDIPNLGEEGRPSVSELLTNAEEKPLTSNPMADPKVTEAERVAKKIKALTDSIEQVARSSAEANSGIIAITKYMETAKAEIRQGTQITAENADLRGKLLALSSEHRRLQQDFETARSEADVLRKNGANIQSTLRETRESINNMRHSNKKMSDDYRIILAENTDLKEKLTDLSETQDELLLKLEVSDTQRSGFKVELDGAVKKNAEYESIIKQKEDAIIAQNESNRSLTSDLSILNRQYKELQDEKITLEEKLDLERENLEHIKRISEQDQRKHDNEAYALRSEIENIASQWRHTKVAAKEISAEVRTLRERSRSAKLRTQELEQELEAAQDMREKYQDEITEQGAKFRELNLQYESVLIELKQEQLQVAQLNKTVKQLTDETKKTQSLRIRHESALEQIKELKSLIQDYQLIKQKNLMSETSYEIHEEENENVISLVQEAEK